MKIKNKKFFKKLNNQILILSMIFFTYIFNHNKALANTNIQLKNKEDFKNFPAQYIKKNNNSSKELDSNIKKAKKFNLPSIEYIKDKKITTKKLLLELINQKFKKSDIIKMYFEMPEENIGALISNDRLAIVSNKDYIEASEKDKNIIERIIEKIEKIEKKYLEKKIPLPFNFNKPIIIITAGHGFEDSGAVKKLKDKEILERNLNAKLVFHLTKSLLKQGFEVYNTYDIEYCGLKLPTKNSSSHIIFKKRPPIRGSRKLCRVADAAHEIIKAIFKKIQRKGKNKNPKICSICIHHNSNPNGQVFGFIPYYEDSLKTSKNFTNSSKKLANIFKKYGNGISPDKKGKNVSKVIADNWVFCHFGGDKEKELKEFDSQSAVLLETEFMSNETQLKKMLKKKQIKKTAKNFTKAICEYFKTKYIKNKKNKI